MTRKSKKILWVLVIIALPILGYTLMYGMNPDTNTGNQVLYTVLLIALGLAVPTLMLKTLFHAAHLTNPQEKELHMRDLPKDKDDAERI